MGNCFYIRDGATSSRAALTSQRKQNQPRVDKNLVGPSMSGPLKFKNQMPWR